MASAGENYPEVGVIIVNFNGLGDTLDCLESLQQQCRADDFIVFLIDNNSREDCGELFTRKFPFEVIPILNKENLGFASANNQGLKEARARGCRYAFLLNNDTVLVSDLISGLRDQLVAYPELGAIGAVNYYFSDPDSVWCAGIRTNFSTGKNRLVTQFDRGKDVLVPVDYVPGSSLMVRMDLLDRAGYLDDHYFAYFEEVDWCYRIKKCGFGVSFLSSSKILHKVGRSSPQAFKEYLRTRNKLYFYKKNHADRFNFVCLLVLLRAFFLSLLSVVRFKPLIAVSYYLGALDFFTNFMGRGRIQFFLGRS